MAVRYLRGLMDDFISMYPEFGKIKNSVGITEDISEKLNVNSLPLLLIENIDFSSYSDYNNNNGKLTFELMYMFRNTNSNGYIDIETKFCDKFYEFLKTKNELSIVGLNYNMAEKQIYGVTYKLQSIHTLF